jgi:hypothetical protein
MINNNGLELDDEWIDYINNILTDNLFDGHEDNIRDDGLIALSKTFTYAKFLDYMNWTQEDLDNYNLIIDKILDNMG